MRVQDVYSHNAVHIPLSCTLQEAAQQMRQKHVGALVVTENTLPDPARSASSRIATSCLMRLRLASAPPRPVWPM